MTQKSDNGIMVSVVMISYNRAAYIGKAIESVVNQKVDFKFELIITDDCSTDGTYEIACEWAERYPGIVKVFRNSTNLGIQANYVEAFKHCTGRYLAMCDCDDYWCSRKKLATQVAYMENHPECSLTFHRVVNSYENDHSKSLSNGGLRNPVTLETLSRGNVITNLSVMYRRGLVDLTKLPEWVLDIQLIDYSIHMFYASRGEIHYFSKPMGVYRLWNDGTWGGSDRYGRLMMSYKVRRYLMEHFKDNTRILPGLVEASRNILLQMMKSTSNDDERGYAQSELIRIRAFENEESIQAALDKLRETKPPMLKRVLKQLRKMISRLVPLP